jgi:endonuclease V-like protein UPF0215 family
MHPKPGSRAVGIAVADGPTRSQLCGAVVRADRVVDGVAFSTCRTGGTDATSACSDLLERLDRPDARWILLAGVAPAWFNLVDVRALGATADRPVIAVSFEASDGLEDPLREHFSGRALAERLERYEALPERTRLQRDDGDLFVRTAGIETASAREVLRAFTPAGRRRPEPLRVARLAARAASTHAARLVDDEET